MKDSPRCGLTLVETLVSLAIIALLMGLLFPAIQAMRESANRTACGNNMRQVALALHSFEGCFSRLPGTMGQAGKRELLHWQAHILPFLEQDSLMLAIDRKLEEGIHVYYMHEERATNIPVFQCPVNPDQGLLISPQIGNLFAFTDYCGVAGAQSRDLSGVFRGNPNLPGIYFSEIRDGLSNTLMFGERPPSGRGDGYGPWLGSQNSLSATIGVTDSAESLQNIPDFIHCPGYNYGFGMGVRGSNCSWTHHWSYHRGGAHFAICDGAIQFLPYQICRDILQALATRAGEETVSWDF